MEQQNKMGTAKMGPLIFSMALPAMISMIINSLYNIVDSIFVAKYSQDALAAVSLVYPLQMLVVAIGVGTGVGVNSLIARRLGEKRQKHADSAAEHGIALAVVGGIAFFILGWGFSGVFVGAFGASEAVSTFAVQYSHLAVGMSIFVMISMMCEKIQQSGGNMIIPMCQGLTGAIINIILDPLMIFGIGPFPEMGIRGAALATVIGQIFGMALGLWGVFRQQKVLNVNMREFKWRGQTIKDIYRVGLPGIVMQSVVSVMTAGMNGILIAFSQTAVNVLGVYFKLQTFVFMPVFGLNQGALPVMGYNYGARRPERVKKTIRLAVFYAECIMLVGFCIFQFLPDKLLGLFAASDAMLAIGVPALRIICPHFLLAGAGIVLSSVFQALGNGVFSLTVSICRQLVVLIPAAWLLSRTGEVNMVWWAFIIAEVFSLALSLVFMARINRTVIVPLSEKQDAAV